MRHYKEYFLQNNTMGILDIYFLPLARVDVAPMKDDMVGHKKTNVIPEQSIWCRDRSMEDARKQNQNNNYDNKTPKNMIRCDQKGNHKVKSWFIL